MIASEPQCVFCHGHACANLFPTTDIAGDTYDVFSCEDCGAWFLYPYPTSEQLNAAYDDSYYGEEDEKFEGMVERVLDYFRHNRAKRLAKWIPKHGAVLDLGCGSGGFLDALSSCGSYKLFGIERPGKAAERASRIPNLKLKTGELEAHDFPAASLDAVTLFHVIEHLPEPVKYLKIISNILKPGGVLMISYPNAGSRQAAWFKGRWLHLDPPRHLWLMPPDSLNKALEPLGFSLETEHHFSIEYNPFGYQQSILNLFFKKRELLYEYLKGNKDYTADQPGWLLRLMKLGYILTFPLFILLDTLDALVKRGGTVYLVFRKTGSSTASTGK